MPGSRVLVVEDSDAIRLPVLSALTGYGYSAHGLADGGGLEDTLREFDPQLVLLDVMLPGRDGFALLEVVRRSGQAGVLMLTARDETADRVRGLAGGADDYLVKPFAMAELLARVTAVLRRIAPGGDVIAIADLEIADDGAVVRRGDRALDLTDTERRLLLYLAHARGRTVSKVQLLTAVWGYEGFADNVVEVHVSSLRRKLDEGRKLEDDGSRLLHTVRGRGYRLAEQ